jgi:hypothetical protein
MMAAALTNYAGFPGRYRSVTVAALLPVSPNEHNGAGAAEIQSSNAFDGGLNGST